MKNIFMVVPIKELVILMKMLIQMTIHNVVNNLIPMVMVSMITWFIMIVMDQLSGVSGLTCVRQMTLITGP